MLVEKICLIPNSYFVRTNDDELSTGELIFSDAVAKPPEFYARAYVDRDEQELEQKLINAGIEGYEFITVAEALERFPSDDAE
ncbi:hypothetical protein [Vibrio casei]|uniref:hypothetical protein n=1 Tax=Vibrio casei TaxID=673372 RepID=UPI003F9BF4BF